MIQKVDSGHALCSVESRAGGLAILVFAQLAVPFFMVSRQNAHSHCEIRRRVSEDLLRRDLETIAAAAGTTVAYLRERIEQEHGEGSLDAAHRLSIIHRAQVGNRRAGEIWWCP